MTNKHAFISLSWKLQKVIQMIVKLLDLYVGPLWILFFLYL